MNRQSSVSQMDAVSDTERPGTLPLFAELPVAEVIGIPKVAPKGEARRAVEPSADRHLRAARRLAKAIRRLPDRSAQQVKTGRAICRHLIALLENGAENGGVDGVQGVQSNLARKPAGSDGRH